MGVRQTTILVILSFVAGLVVASFAGFREFIPGLLEGAWVTVRITVQGCLLAVVMAVIAGIAKMYGPWPLRWLAVCYIEVFRGTSALVQLFWLFFVLPHFGVFLEPMTVAVVGLGLNVGAYGAEVVRGAIQAVPRGQWEASTALNLTRMQALRRIILPQALVAMIPPWGNLFIELLKSTAIVSLITIGDLAFRAQQMNQTTLKTVQIFSIVLVMYLAISMVITLLMRLLERRAAAGLSRGRVS
ncbi:amino acid ABC transporter membrane protein 1, PAAT family [Tistlia consotensis]|uniref:Amino acid ABC transporter membrane protein 1, PAAT family n=1 Tax=Tistlia consotensis USBA 355 TaxID=560819 RepID=A0A1Y6CJ54_9PROT|nr:ectoine/hydroxyectoine ABC transporter permease subunit EhuC [Tistlia consotensis]SMF56951.1 amino acid ABC transporter membrane protein 1, PAAT family [Tistlia consotensis USBA 355]SNR45135.1 amino acid ABC transporter membrane protein 1, PAAT family [Tistlia consotensis]